MTFDFDSYIKKVQEDLRRGNATEHTYRSALEALIESFGKGIEASNDPKHIECGAPDFIVERGKVPLGYVETKDIGVDLDRIEKTDQMKRYLKALNNLILTDYLEFRWYVNGEKRLTLHLATAVKNKVVVNPLGAQSLEQMLRDFFLTEAPTVNTPKELATRLAEVTHFIKDRISEALEGGDDETRQALERQYKVFVELLLPALTHKEFADLYAQTVTYGLFAAKMVAEEQETERIPFTLESATLFLRRIPFLRRLFQDVNEQLDEIDLIRPYLKDIVSLLNRSRMDEILADFGQRTRTEDPVVHFYETFLAVYDPKMRESRGVYYTPEPVVQFIVRSVDEVLKTRFGKPWGLADESVKVLDPATGTGTFLYYVIQQIHEEIVNVRGQGGQWQAKSKEMLKRLYGFELLIAPYVISHLKLGLLMEHLGAPLEARDERMHVYLTNTLEEGLQRKELLPGLGYGIAEESREAAKVKQADDIMVVLGNPPYSGHSANASKDKDGNLNFIGKLVRDYYFVDGSPLGERNPKWLQDDYVKFIRYGEWRINKSGKGVLAFITNHGYLDNPTFRGMRQHLMQTFDEIYVLDLHGNSKKKEVAPDGSKDENVFDIQQGVAIFIGIKTGKGTKNKQDFIIKHHDIWGSREEKYYELSDNETPLTNWEPLTPDQPYYLFIKQTSLLKNEYQRCVDIREIFPVNSVGFQTHRDYLVIDISYKVLLDRITDFIFNNQSISDKRQKFFSHLPKSVYPPGDTRDWKLETSLNDLRKINDIPKWITVCLRRPFDFQYYFFHPAAVEYGRPQIMDSLLNRENLALLWTRPMSPKYEFSVFVSDCTVDQSAIGNKVEGAGGTYVGPLLLQNSYSVEGGLFDKLKESQLNISTKIISWLIKTYSVNSVENNQNDVSVLPEKLFFYIYAILHSPTYRKRYAEFLKIDFPRVPLTSDKELFFKLAELGGELVDLHLLRSAKVNEFITTYPVRGSNKVEKVFYNASREDAKNAKENPENKVYINSTQYFGGVSEEVWQFKIGGYQVCEKWLKDRKGRVLSAEDISHYQRVVVALHETIRLMSEIDAAIPKWPVE